MKKILISGYYGFKNAGDEAILASIIDSLKQRKSDVDITILSANPAYTTETTGVTAVPRMKLTAVLKAISKTDLFISGGGGLFQDVTSSRSILYYLSLVFLAKLFHKKIVILANGIGPVTKKLNRRLMKWVLKGVDLITVRDEVSVKELDAMGVEQKVHLTADPVLVLKEENLDAVDQKTLDAAITLEEDKFVIGVSVRNWKNYDSFSQTIAGFLDFLVSNYPVQVVFLPMHYPGDVNVSLDIKQKMTMPAEVVTGHLNHHELRYMVGKLDMMIGMRLHALVFASQKNIPSLGIVYDAKVESYLGLVNQYSLGHVESLDQVVMINTFTKAYNNQKNYLRELQESVDKLQKLSEKNMDFVMALLEETNNG